MSKEIDQWQRKYETRNPKSEINSNAKTPMTQTVLDSLALNSEFVSDFVLRISDFVRHLPFPGP